MSVFRRLTRYAGTPVLEPRENRLTESLATVLEHVPALGLTLVEETLASAHKQHPPIDDASDSLGVADEIAERAREDGFALRVETQRLAAGHCFVDLELRLSPAGSTGPDGDVLVWVENKHGAGLHGNQLDDYMVGLAQMAGAAKLLILLGPRETSPLEGVPPSVIRVDWQTLARRLAAVAPEDPVERWITQQFVDYLREEGLMDPDRMTAADVYVTSAEPRAHQAIALICEIVAGAVASHWAEATRWHGRGKPDFGWWYWATYPNAPTGADAAGTWRGSWFEWALKQDTARSNPRNAWVFGAGLTMRVRDNPTIVDANEGWLRVRREQGFEQVTDHYERLWRFKYPEELLAEPTLDRQATALADWVLETFHLLRDNPPPA